jgi:hypothetical protein
LGSAQTCKGKIPLAYLLKGLKVLQETGSIFFANPAKKISTFHEQKAGSFIVA